MNKVLPQAVEQRTWKVILKEGFHPSTAVFQQETPFWTVLHHFKGRDTFQYIMDWDTDCSVSYLLYTDNCSLKDKHWFLAPNPQPAHPSTQHLPEEWVLKPSMVALSSMGSATPALWITSTAEPCILALLVRSYPQVFISCPVPTQIIQKVKCCLPFCIVTNLSTLSFSSVIHININGETNMCVIKQKRTKINEKKCGHQQLIIHSKLHRGSHQGC